MCKFIQTLISFIMKKNHLFLFTGLLSLVTLFANAQYRRQPMIPDKAENSIRIMTYNIRNGQDVNQIPQLRQITDLIQRVQPDVIAVQDVDSATQSSQGIHILKELGDQNMMYTTFAPIYNHQGGKHGLGILSRSKPLNYHYISLPGREEQRGLLIAEFKDYLLCCTQLSQTEEDRQASVPLIFKAIEGVQKPVFLAGDMNCDYPSPSQNAIQSKFKTLNSFKEETIPVINQPNIPYGCIDFVYGYSEKYKYAVLNSQVIPMYDFDHYPLYVDVRISRPADQIFRTKPYLQKPIDNGITVCWLTHVPTYSWIEYGENGKTDQKKQLYVDGQMLCNNTNHQFRLEGLKPGVTYSYRVCSQEIISYEAYKKVFGDTAYSDVYTYTPRAENETDFTALIFNDMHNNNQLMDMFTDLIKKNNIQYDFVFYNGDCVDAPKDEVSAVSVLNQLNKIAQAETKPFFFIRGNHEIRNAYSIGLRNLFDYIDGKTYGAFNWGNTRFVMLDCGEDKPDSTWVYYGLNDFTQLRIDQAEFLKKELSSPAFKLADRRILIHHVPIYADREGSYNPSNELWAPLLANAPFDISINAHRHRFVHYPAKEVGNNFPVIVGGGSQPEGAYMLILEKKGKQLTFRALDVQGNEKLKLNL